MCTIFIVVPYVQLSTNCGLDSLPIYSRLFLPVEHSSWSKFFLIRSKILTMADCQPYDINGKFFCRSLKPLSCSNWIVLLLTQLIVWPMETSWSRAWLMAQVKYFYIIVITSLWKEVYPQCASLTWGLTLTYEMLCSYGKSYIRWWLIK